MDLVPFVGTPHFRLHFQRLCLKSSLCLSTLRIVGGGDFWGFFSSKKTNLVAVDDFFFFFGVCFKVIFVYFLFIELGREQGNWVRSVFFFFFFCSMDCDFGCFGGLKQKGIRCLVFSRIG